MGMKILTQGQAYKTVIRRVRRVGLLTGWVRWVDRVDYESG